MKENKEDNKKNVIEVEKNSLDPYPSKESSDDFLNYYNDETGYVWVVSDSRTDFKNMIKK